MILLWKVTQSGNDVLCTIGSDSGQGEETLLLSASRYRRIAGEFFPAGTLLLREAEAETADGNACGSCADGACGALPLPLSPAAYDALQTGASYTEALRVAANLQARAPHSKMALRRKLTERGFDGQVAKTVVRYLESRGYLDEGEQACAFADTLVRRKRMGRARVAASLLQRGYEREAVSRAVESVPQAAYDTALLTELAHRGVPVPAGTEEEGEPTMEAAEKRKLVAALARRGFSAAEIRRAMQTYAQEQQERRR